MLLGRSWGALGRCWAALGRSERHLGKRLKRSWGDLGRCWGALRESFKNKSIFASIWDRFWAPFWELLGTKVANKSMKNRGRKSDRNLIDF